MKLGMVFEGGANRTVFSCGVMDKFLEENGYAKKIRSGKYKIPKNAKYDEIAKIITKQN